MLSYFFLLSYLFLLTFTWSGPKFEKHNAQFYKYGLLTNINMYFEVGNLENIMLNFTSCPYSPKMRIFYTYYLLQMFNWYLCRYLLSSLQLSSKSTSNNNYLGIYTGFNKFQHQFHVFLNTLIGMPMYNLPFYTFFVLKITFYWPDIKLNKFFSTSSEMK